jgi:hypothetical protein
MTRLYRQSIRQFHARRARGTGIAAILAFALNYQPERVSAALFYADSVIAFSSQYSSSDWSAAQALGAPNTNAYGDIPTAWAALNTDGPPNPEFITLGYSTPIFADGVTVWETNANGFVTQIDLLDTSNVFHTVFAGADPSLPGTPVGFTVTFASTAYEVKGVKVFVDPLSTIADWEEIDAVGLNGTFVPEPSTLLLLGIGAISLLGRRKAKSDG